MNHHVARPGTRRTPRSTTIGVILLTAAVIGIVAHHSASSLAQSLTDILGADTAGTTTQPGGAAATDDGVVDERDGVLPDGVSVFDEMYPGVANIDADLLHAVRTAATDAAADGIVFTVSSGWRSPQYQAQLRREAIVQHGSEEEAARWVADADTSTHLSGDAVDIGHVDARAWLRAHGARYGLCQIYGNEPWHVELRPEAIEHGCPPMYADAAQDPRLQEGQASLQISRQPR